MTRDELFTALHDACQQYGFTTEHTDDLIEAVIDSVEVEPRDPPGWEGGFADNH